MSDIQTEELKKRYSTLKELQEESKTRLIQIEAKIEAERPEYERLLLQLENDYKVTTIEEAEKLFDKLTQEFDQKLKEIENKVLDTETAIIDSVTIDPVSTNSFTIETPVTENTEVTNA